jgi:acyl carrier protein
MQEQEILSQINAIFSTVFKRPDLTVSPSTNAAEVKGWDSLTHVQLIDAIERKFGVKFKLMEVVKFNNVGDIVNCLKTKTA